MENKRPELRKRLNELFRTDEERRAFLIDYFPEVASNASANLSGVGLWNLFLQTYDQDEVEHVLQKHLGQTRKKKPQPVAGEVPAFQLTPTDPWFTGRSRDLLALRRLLTQHRGVTVRGIGGLGKSSLVRQYVYKHRAEYTFVGWLSADSPTSLETAYCSLAGFLSDRGLSSRLAPSERNPQERLKFTLDELSQLNNWLLVLDNADHPQSLDALWPNAERGHVLVTTRSPADARFPEHELPPWAQNEALRFLSRRSKQKLIGPDEITARKLLTEVESLPLAVEQIAAYLATHKTPIARYWQAFQQERTRLFTQSRGKDDRGSVVTVWSLAFAEVEAESPAAADLLRVSAYLSPDGIPEKLLTESAAQLGMPLHAALSTDHPLAVDEVLAPLLRHSLIRRFEGPGYEPHFAVHRLVQSVLRDRLRAAQEDHCYLECAVEALSHAFPDPNEFTNWPRCRDLLPSAESVWPFADAMKTQTAARLWNHVAVYLSEQARYAEAEPIFHRSQAIWEATVGADHPSVAETLNDLAVMLGSQGRHAAAEPLHRRSLAIREKALGPDHPEVARSLSNLAWLLGSQGKSAEAEPFSRRSLAIREKALGPDHPDVATSLNNLALLRRNQGQYFEAEPLYRRSLAIREKSLGPNHPDIAFSLFGLAVLLYNQGKSVEAESLYRQSLAIWERALGSDHPWTRTARENLDILLQAKQAPPNLQS